MCLFCIFTSGFIEAFEIAEIENSVPQQIASSQTWWVLFIWLIVNFVTWLTGVLGTCSIESGTLGQYRRTNVQARKATVKFQIAMISLLVTFFHVNDLFNLKNRSPTSQGCHQYQPSPTFVTNIDVVTCKLFLCTPILMNHTGA